MTILLDYNRATRETVSEKNDEKVVQSSKSLLLPLVSKGANVNFYLTHKLSGWRQWIQRLPQWNELCALHHMKLYLFDDNIVISGANLSDMYFTNRQDRYILIRNSPEICDYFDDLIQTVSKFSLNLDSKGNFALDPDWKYDPRKFFHQRGFRKHAKHKITKLNEKHYTLSSRYDLTEADSVLFPLIQMKSIGVDDEEHFFSSLITSCPKTARMCVATGYFNLTDSYQQHLLQCFPKYRTTIVMASEEANGFYNGSGILKYIPYVYTQYVKRFLRNVRTSDDISIFYYCRPSWSFHGKGIWLFNQKYLITMFGSSNFGYRSVFRDNEAQVVLLTKDPALIESFSEEYQHLVDQSRLIQTEADLPSIPLWVQAFSRVFRSFF